MFLAAILENNCHIWKQRPWIYLLENLVQKQKSLNLGPKVPDLQILGPEFENTIAVFWNQPPRICVRAKFGAKNKNP